MTYSNKKLIALSLLGIFLYILFDYLGYLESIFLVIFPLLVFEYSHSFSLDNYLKKLIELLAVAFALIFLLLSCTFSHYQSLDNALLFKILPEDSMEEFLDNSDIQTDEKIIALKSRVDTLETMYSNLHHKSSEIKTYNLNRLYVYFSILGFYLCAHLSYKIFISRRPDQPQVSNTNDDSR